MFEHIWDDVLCHIACGNFYFTQIGELVGEANVEKILVEMQKAGLINFTEVRTTITEDGLKRIQGKLISMLKKEV